ncbi:hypothetical protein ACIGEZ_19790 [Streptomyces sp. NPDC085481]|uniref:hypothetical protein n=1 Tax=Streptomyces sp. NPDC085481 TaxID=3365727 RepID=UPI0037D188C2
MNSEARWILRVLESARAQLAEEAGEQWPRLLVDLDDLLDQAHGGRLTETGLTRRLDALIEHYPVVGHVLADAVSPQVLMEHDAYLEWHPAFEWAAADDLTRPRFVNLAIEPRGSHDLVARGEPLEPARDYFVRFDLGDVSQDSIVLGAKDHAFPSHELPETTKGHWLDVALTSADLDVELRSQHFFLPRHGPGWGCPCKPETPHDCSPETRHSHIFFRFRTPATPGSAEARVSVWHRNHLVQSLKIVADIAPAGGAGDHVATVDYTLTSELTDLDEFAPRGLSVLTNQRPDGTHSLIFNGGGGEIGFTVAEAALTQEMGRVRQLLLDVHAEGPEEERHNLLNDRNGKSPAQFQQDLERLARQGWRMWAGLLYQQPERLREVSRGPTTTIQVARVPLTTFVYPWAAVYDLPIDPTPDAPLTLCPVVQDWDGTSDMISSYPDRCPEWERHQRKNTLCPFGFWGIRHVIENPPSTRTPARQVSVVDEPRIVLVRNQNLNGKLTSGHAAALQHALPGFTLTTADSLEEVGTALTECDLELVEFYCHGKGDPTGHWLEVGSGDQLHPDQIATWEIANWAPPNGPEGHWQTTTPLIILNGCHTVELTPQSPVNFVDAFAAVHASGVIGTEISTHQSLAGEVTERMLTHFAPGQIGMGEAARRTRHDLLAKGNLLGLAYTAYCSADLRLVPLR